MRIFVPGGCGYVGAMLVPHLVAVGHKVTVLDTMWFGSGYLPEDNENLKVIRGDIRDHATYVACCKKQDAVIFLASLSNNDLCVKEPELALAVNETAFARCVWAARAMGVKRFIYASSVAVYGSTEEDAAEDHPLNPTTPYAIAKAHCERVLLDHIGPGWTVAITRSASVCGYSLRQRFDLTVNKMVHDAVSNGSIRVNGGMQRRCHIHMSDLIASYKLLLHAHESINGQAFNLVCENQAVMTTAEIVSEETGVPAIYRARTDDRSYTVDGAKAKAMLRFSPQKGVRQAAAELKGLFDGGLHWKDLATNVAYQNLASGIA